MPEERLLVCLRPNPDSARLVSAAARLAETLHARLVVAYVETPSRPLSDAETRWLAAAFELAEQAGGETAMLGGDDVGRAILAFATGRGIRKIVVGKPARPRWRELLGRSPVDAILRRSGHIDVFAIAGGERTSASRSTGGGARLRPTPLLGAVAVAALSTVLCRALFPRFDRANLVMVYLLGVAFVAVRFGRVPAAVAACLSVAAFDFFFVPPYNTFVVHETQYLVTFAVMLAVALLISDLAARLRGEAEAARERERRTHLLYATSRDLARLTDPDAVGRAATRHVADAFQGAAALFLPSPAGLRSLSSEPPFGLEPQLIEAAGWAFREGRSAGLGATRFPDVDALVIPLAGAGGRLGVLAVRPHAALRPLAQAQLDLIDTFGRLIAASLERTSLAAATERAQMEIQAERLRNTLLSSVSHDLRTPLAAITGAATSLLEAPGAPPGNVGRDLVQTIHEEAERLDRMVANLLDMTRLDSGTVRLDRQWHSVEELVGGALRAVERTLEGRRVATDIPADLPLVAVDALMIERVLVNLLDNAVRHTPAAATIRISSSASNGSVEVEVADDGPGVPAGDEGRIFEKFVRSGAPRGGFGLGLAICRAIVNAHGGRIWAGSVEPRGAAFRFTVPLEGAPPPPPETAEDAGA